MKHRVLRLWRTLRHLLGLLRKQNMFWIRDTRHEDVLGGVVEAIYGWRTIKAVVVGFSKQSSISQLPRYEPPPSISISNELVATRKVLIAMRRIKVSVVSSLPREVTQGLTT